MLWGFGINGYIQINKFFVKLWFVWLEVKEFQIGWGVGGVLQKVNEDILEYDCKRCIQFKLIELEGQLVDQGYLDEEVLECVEILCKVLEVVGVLEVDDMDFRFVFIFWF